MYREIIDFLKMNDVKYKENKKLADISPVKIGAEAELIVYPDNVKVLVELICLMKNLNYRYKIAGRMSNLLPPDAKYRGAVIRTDLINGYTISNNRLTADCGAVIAALSRVLQKNGLGGFAGLCGIPGSIGGAIVGNAGAFGSEISDYLLQVSLFSLAENRILRLGKSDCGFSYRNSALKSNDFILLSATFDLPFGDPDDILAEMNRYKKIRLESQPTDMPSLGSSFKRPCEDISAGYLIDKCGLKGRRVGGAMVSYKHAGFIVNVGGATAEDYIQLSNIVSDSVYESYKIKLIREVEIM